MKNNVRLVYVPMKNNVRLVYVPMKNNVRLVYVPLKMPSLQIEKFLSLEPLKYFNAFRQKI